MKVVHICELEVNLLIVFSYNLQSKSDNCAREFYLFFDLIHLIKISIQYIL